MDIAYPCRKHGCSFSPSIDQKHMNVNQFYKVTYKYLVKYYAYYCPLSLVGHTNFTPVIYSLCSVIRYFMSLRTFF